MPNSSVNDKIADLLSINEAIALSGRGQTSFYCERRYSQTFPKPQTAFHNGRYRQCYSRAEIAEYFRRMTGASDA